MLLDRVGEVETYPFPHVVIQNALPSDYYAELVKHQPVEEIFRSVGAGENQRVDIPTNIATSSLHPIWNDFCAKHVSKEWWRKVWSVFGVEIEKRYLLRKKPRVGEGLSLRCQPGVNTPTEQISKVRGPHLDNPTELFAGLFYMAQDDDGGDLEIYKAKGELKFHGKLEVEESCVELVKTVKYRPNTFLLFLNTIDSLHGVTPRKSKAYRRLVNVVGDMNYPLFTVGHNGF